MDSLRAFDDGVEFDGGTDDDPVMEAPPEIGTDERRMHVRAYNHWVAMLDGRAYPSIHDLKPDNLDDFGPQSVLLDFSAGSEDPVITFIGAELREECALGHDITRISQVPARSLLSRLTDHYLQIIANCAPIGFEAEFMSQRGANTMYRGILMPLSSDGDTIDFIYGVINWKELADNDTAVRLAQEVDRAITAAPPASASPVWADGPNSDDVLTPSLPLGDTLAHNFGDDIPATVIAPDAGLADRLCVARESAEAVKSADTRSRAALYRALGQAYDFAIAAAADPADYAEILEDAGLKAQDRAPMTPVVKLVFGAEYDKTRLTEFAAALSFANRQSLPQGGLGDYLERFTGGLKGIVQAERQLRRPDTKPDTGEALRAALREATPHAFVEMQAKGGEFVLLVARREDDGRLAIVAQPIVDAHLIDRAIRKTAA